MYFTVLKSNERSEGEYIVHFNFGRIRLQICHGRRKVGGFFNIFMFPPIYIHVNRIEILHLQKRMFADSANFLKI